jgi:hypothetical protein
MSLKEILAELPKLSEEEFELLENAVKKRSTRAPSFFDLAGDLLEGADDLPGDLSTNPKYMENFGK